MHKKTQKKTTREQELWSFVSVQLLWYYVRLEDEKNKAPFSLSPLKPSGHYMYDQFNIQQLYALPTLYLCVFYLSENKQRPVPLTA